MAGSQLEASSDGSLAFMSSHSLQSKQLQCAPGHLVNCTCVYGCIGNAFGISQELESSDTTHWNAESLLARGIIRQLLSFELMPQMPSFSTCKLKGPRIKSELSKACGR